MSLPETAEDTDTPTSWLLGRLALLKANASAMSCARLLSLAPPSRPSGGDFDIHLPRHPE